MEFIEYNKCTTCKKAKKLLIDNKVCFQDRDIKENNPSNKEINDWLKKYNIDINKLFNTSGLLYRELKLKNRIKSMSIEEKIQLLSSNGMLVKRPILINDNYILIGFRENEWKEYLIK